MHENQTQCTLAPLGLQSTCCLQKLARVCMLGTLAKKTKKKDHSPSMTLSWLPKQNDQVPQEKLPKILDTIAIMVYTPVPFNILTQDFSPNTMVKQHC